MRRSSRSLPWLAFALCCVGCAADGTFWGLERPRIFGPGPIEAQRNRANLHDPYPDPAGGPDMGTRPREFDKPLPEPVKSRYLLDSWWGR